MQKSRHDVWVGLFVLVGIAAILFLALRAGNLLSLNFGETYAVVAEFNNIGGLKPRAAVKSAGVVIGRVESIAFDNKKFLARVTLQLDKKFKFPSDSNAKILTSGLLGEQYIGLEPGAETTPLAANNVLERTQDAVVLEDLIGQFLYNKAAEPPAAPGGAKK